MTEGEGQSKDKIWRHIVAGAGAGWATALVTCPLDVVKVRLQSHATPMGNPINNPLRSTSSSAIGVTVSTLRSIWQHEGIRGLYRGLGVTMVGYLPSFAIYFPTYHWSKGFYSRHRPHWPEPLVHIMAAMTAGGTGNALTNPLWVVRTRLMTQHVLMPSQGLYHSTWDALKQIWRGEGLWGFYKGASTSLLGVIHVAVQFPLYERIKEWSGPHASDPLYIILASTISKVVASTVSYPHEILRTQLQIQRSAPHAADHKGLVDIIVNIWRTKGISGFYSGLSTNIIRVIPASAVTFLSYEMIVKYL